ALRECLHRQLLDALAYLVRLRGRRHRLAEHDGDRPPYALRPLEEEAAALVAEDASPDAVDVDRHDRTARVGGDALEAALELQEISGARDRALGEDAHRMTFGDLLAGDRQRLFGLVWGVARGHRDHAHAAKEPVERRPLVVLAKHQEA